MGPTSLIIATFVALLAGAFVGAALVVIGLLGRADLSHPSCRRCRADLRPAAWQLAGGFGGSAAPPPTCPGCGASLRRRAVRWRPFPIHWRTVVLGVGLLVACPALHLWGSARMARGLTWRDLLPVALDLRAARGLGYPEPQGTFARGSPVEHVWGSGPWRSLSRRASAGTLGMQELAEAALIIDETVDGEGGASLFQRTLNWPAPHADLLMAILRSDVDTRLRARVASILVSAPTLMVVGAGGSSPECGVTADLTLVSPGAGQLWGDVSQCTGRLDEFRLDALFFVGEVRLDGAPIPSSPLSGRGRSGTLGMHQLPHGTGWSTMPAVSCRLDAAPGVHRIELELEIALVDHSFAAALIGAQGEAGPPERWGVRTVVRRVVLSTTVVLLEPAVKDVESAP